MARHLERRHGDETDVARILNLNKKSKERRVAWTALLDQGNLRHNFSVLESKKGVLVPKYLKKDKVYSETGCVYLPCEFCLALCSKTELWDHQKRCQCRDSTYAEGKPVCGGGIKNGRLLLPVQASKKDFYENILIRMMDDDIKATIEGDLFIIISPNEVFGDIMVLASPPRPPRRL